MGERRGLGGQRRSFSFTAVAPKAVYPIRKPIVRPLNRKRLSSFAFGISACLLASTFSCSAESGNQPAETLAPTEAWGDVLAFKEPFSVETIASLEDHASGKDRHLRAVAAVLLYRHAPDQYWDTLLSAYAVHDYEERAKGIYNFMERDETVQHINALAAACPESDLGKAPAMLHSFLDYQDKNQWLQFEDGARISLARFFRTAFFTQMLPQQDAAEIANRMDQAVRD